MSSARSLYNTMIDAENQNQVNAIFERFHRGATYDARVTRYISRPPASDRALKERIKDLSDYVRAKDDYQFVRQVTIRRGANDHVAHDRRLLGVRNLKLRILWNKVVRMSNRSGGLSTNQLVQATEAHLKSLVRSSGGNPDRLMDSYHWRDFSREFATMTMAWGSGPDGVWNGDNNSNSNSNSDNNNNSTRMNLNRVNSANTRKNIQWKNVRLNSLNNKNESIGGSTFQVGNKAVKLWRNHYVSLRTLRGLTKNNASDVYNKRQNAVIAKNPWTRNDILRKNIEFVKFV